MNLFYSPYLLKKKSHLNARDHSGTQNGVLIKISKGDYWGVADLCPKPEFGDNTLENEIKNKGPLFLRALELAKEDLAARTDNKSLLQDKPIENNFLITDYKSVNLNHEHYRNQTVKIKADRDILSLSRLLNGAGAEVVIRLDFNSILSADEFENFLKLLSSEAVKKIEYIEDPTVFNLKWKSWNIFIPLAFDLQLTEYEPEYAKYRIIKPSRQKINVSENFTLTSAMEHPVGLAHALRISQQHAKNISGFLTLDLFEPSNFNKYFEQKKNYLNFSARALALPNLQSDFGIGMSEALDKLQWDEL